MKHNYIILILTIQGCVGCNVLIKNTKTAIFKSGKFEDIKLKVQSNEEVGIDFLKEHNIKDFPTLMIMNDENNVLFEATGSYPVAPIMQWIKIHCI